MHTGIPVCNGLIGDIRNAVIVLQIIALGILYLMVMHSSRKSDKRQRR